ncbi:uncharacterized protein BJX67DRAFT_352132 [Aspergillus lucknowensis]|uniref:Protein kinase domain-containing protein n=1 Tax=Aspergillus lucknowensis TaxID=176173 RepID=A0ABR4LT71_9EURO
MLELPSQQAVFRYSTSANKRPESQYPMSQGPYLGLPTIGNGMTGIVFKLEESRVVKKAKQYLPGSLPDPAHVEYINQINQQTLENEIQVFKRLGSHEGIIHCLLTQV